MATSYQQRQPTARAPISLSRQIPEHFLPKIKLPNASKFSWNPYKGNSLAGETRNVAIESLLDTFLTLKTDQDRREKLGDPLVRGAYRDFVSMPFHKQLEVFEKSYLVTSRQSLARWQLAVDVLYNLRLFFPNCQVYAFGSLLTGLSDPSSDVDLYVDLFGDDGGFMKTHQQPKQNAALRKIQMDLESILRYSKCPHTGRNFACLVERLGSRVRFIRFQHCVSDVKCDISFGNRMSVQNSRLLKFYMSYDKRIELLLVFLRYVAKLHGISGEMKIKQYALSLLVIVFLAKKNVVPSVHLLQSIAAQERSRLGFLENPDEFNGEDASFCDDRQIVDKYFTPVPISSDLNPPGRDFLGLISEFYEMYAFIDFENVVVCPIVGDFIAKEDFLSLDSDKLPNPLKLKTDCLKSFEHDRPLCIQDPFTLAFNVGGIAGRDVVRKFTNVCKTIYEKLSSGGGDEVRSILDLFVSPVETSDEDGD